MSLREFRCVSEIITMAFVAGFFLGGIALRAADDAENKATAADVEQPAVQPEAESTTESKSLSVAPQAEIIVPPGRPEWVDRAPIRNKTTSETTVCSDPFATREACLPALDAKIQDAVSDYIIETTGSKYAPTVLRYELVSLKDRLVHDNYEETIVSPSVGPMHQIHARIQFNDSFRDEIAEKWLQLRSGYRVAQVGGGFLLVLGVLATIAGFFRADNASRGYYTGRLQWVAAAAILGLIVLGAFFARIIPWI